MPTEPGVQGVRRLSQVWDKERDGVPGFVLAGGQTAQNSPKSPPLLILLMTFKEKGSVWSGHACDISPGANFPSVLEETQPQAQRLSGQ